VAITFVRWAMADIIKKLDFKMGAGLTRRFNRDSEDTLVLLYYLIYKASCYYRLNLI
jgi:hypothetical protein